MVPSLYANNLYIDCMPIVGPDPILGSYDAEYDNGAGATAGTALVTNSELVMTNPAGQQLTWTFGVSPTDSGSVAAGASVIANHNKQAGAGVGDPCSFCGGTWDLNVDWTVGGLPVSDTLSGSVYCVF